MPQGGVDVKENTIVSSYQFFMGLLKIDHFAGLPWLRHDVHQKCWVLGYHQRSAQNERQVLQADGDSANVSHKSSNEVIYLLYRGRKEEVAGCINLFTVPVITVLG